MAMLSDSRCCIGGSDQCDASGTAPREAHRMPGTPGKKPPGLIRMSHPEMDCGVASHSWMDPKSKVPVRGPAMETHRSLQYVTMRTGEPAGRHRREPWWAFRSRVTRGILVLALVLGSLGATAPAWLGHGGAGHVHASAHQPARGHHRSAGAGWASPCICRPWMY